MTEMRLGHGTWLRLTAGEFFAAVALAYLSAIEVYAGSSVPKLKTLADPGVSGILTTKAVVALVLSGIFSLLAEFLAKRPSASVKPSTLAFGRV